MKRDKCYSPGFWRSSKAGVFLMLVLGGLSLPFSQTYAQGEKTQPTVNDNTSCLFSYQQQSGLLVRTYNDNNEKCLQITTLFKRHRKEILSGKSHFAITSYIRPADLNNPKIMNSASIQASVVRAYIKVWGLISHEHFTFVFDTAHYVNYKVRVDYIPSPIPKSANQQINYVLSNNIAYIIHSVKRYTTIPLAGSPIDKYKDNIAKAPEPVKSQTDQKTDLPLPDSSLAVIKAEPPIQQKQVETMPVESTKKTEPLSVAIDKAYLPVFSMQPKDFNPTICIKTNLLYWIGITPETKYKEAIPNIEAEWFFSKHWSLNVDAAYNYTKKANATKEIWGLSSIGLEPRFWLRDNRFSGFYVGVYGLTGEFDIKKNNISTNGYTGAFNEGGISLGYHLELSSRWGIEAGARVGYRTTNCDIYKYAESKHYYKQSSFTQNDFKLTGIRLLITYHLWKNSIK